MTVMELQKSANLKRKMHARRRKSEPIPRSSAATYTAGYLWAELLAADGFMAFAEAGVVDRATGDRFREEVLSRGATRPARESFRAFRGRDPKPDAMLVRHAALVMSPRVDRRRLSDAAA
jgi:Zn-dependent oligopeptidase